MDLQLICQENKNTWLVEENELKVRLEEEWYFLVVFLFLRHREKDSSHALVPSPNACNSQELGVHSSVCRGVAGTHMLESAPTASQDAH